MIKEQTYKQWVAGLPKSDAKKNRSFFRVHGEIYYRDSMGGVESLYCGNDQIPEMVRCYKTRQLCWVSECNKIKSPDSSDVYICRMAANMYKLVNAISECGRAVVMLREDTIKVGSSRASIGCIGKSVSKCEMSGEWCFSNEMSTYGDYKVSPNWMQRQIQELVIQQHNYRPDEFVIPKSNEYAGIEIEVEASERGLWQYPYIEGAKMMKENFSDILFMKRDGSLMNGFEIVTHPIEWEVIRDRLSPALGKLAAMGMRSHESGRCGLHVHLPRNSMSQLEIAKYVLLWNSDNEWIRLTCGRTGAESESSGRQNYCRIIPNVKIMFNGGPSAVNHYSAINTTNPATIEIRSFRGTLNPNTFLARIGMTFLVRSYIKQSSVKPNWEEFVRWLIKNKHERARFPESWAMIATCAKRMQSFSESLREEVGSMSAKKSTLSKLRKNKKKHFEEGQ